MPYDWPEDTEFAFWELEVLDRDCPACGRMMYVCDHRYRRIHTLDGPVQLVSKLNHCPDPRCLAHAKTKSPELEVTIALPKWAIGWDVFCWIGHRRCSRHWSVSPIQSELLDEYAIKISDDSISRYIRHYQGMLAARQQDPQTLRRPYESVQEIILLRRLIARAKAWAESLGKPVALWISDKQDAFVSGIAAEFPEVPHRYCDNHFLRDVAKPVLEMDSHAEEPRAADSRPSARGDSNRPGRTNAGACPGRA
jgi:hypothetical protein